MARPHYAGTLWQISLALGIVVPFGANDAAQVPLVFPDILRGWRVYVGGFRVSARPAVFPLATAPIRVR